MLLRDDAGDQVGLHGVVDAGVAGVVAGVAVAVAAQQDAGVELMGEGHGPGERGGGVTGGTDDHDRRGTLGMDRRHRLVAARREAPAGRQGPGEDPAEDRRRLLERRELRRHPGGRDRPRVVEAGDREERLHGVVLEGAVGVARGVGVGEEHQRLPVTAERRAEGLGQQDPVAPAVEGDRHAVERVARGQLAVAGRQGRGSDLVDQGADGAEHLGHAVAEEAAP